MGLCSRLRRVQLPSVIVSVSVWLHQVAAQGPSFDMWFTPLLQV